MFLLIETRTQPMINIICTMRYMTKTKESSSITPVTTGLADKSNTRCLMYNSPHNPVTTEAESRHRSSYKTYCTVAETKTQLSKVTAWQNG